MFTVDHYTPWGERKREKNVRWFVKVVLTIFPSSKFGVMPEKGLPVRKVIVEVIKLLISHVEMNFNLKH